MFYIHFRQYDKEKEASTCITNNDIENVTKNMIKVEKEMNLLEDIEQATNKLSLNEIYSTPRKTKNSSGNGGVRRSILKSGSKTTNSGKMLFQDC